MTKAAYAKPTLELSIFRPKSNLVKLFDYKDGLFVPVTVFDIKEKSWNGAPQS